MSETGGKPRRKDLIRQNDELQSKLKNSLEAIKDAENTASWRRLLIIIFGCYILFLSVQYLWLDADFQTLKKSMQTFKHNLEAEKQTTDCLRNEMDNLRSKYEYLDSMFVFSDSTSLSFPTTQVSTLNRDILMAGPIVCNPIPQQYVQYENGFMTSILYTTKHVCKNSVWESSPLSIHDVSTPTNDTDFIRCFILEDNRVLPESCTIHIKGSPTPQITPEPRKPEFNSFVGQLFCTLWQFCFMQIVAFLDDWAELLLVLFDIWYSIILFFSKRFGSVIIMFPLFALLFYGNVLLKCIKDGTSSLLKWMLNGRIIDMRIRFAKWLKSSIEKEMNLSKRASFVEVDDASPTETPKKAESNAQENSTS